MKTSIHQQLITFGITPKFLYQGVERLSPRRAEEVHVWAVQVLGGHPTAVLTDRYRATRNEYEAIRDGETTVTEQYTVSFVSRMEDLLSLDGSFLGYETWLDVQGVSFGVTIEDSRENQEFWRGRFDNDMRCYKEFTEVICGADRAREFLSTTVSR